MGTHIARVCIPTAEFERVNRLLSIQSLENMRDSELIAQRANTYHCEGIFHAVFDDGSLINFDLCSDNINYWDDVVWTSPDGRMDVMLECEYELGDIEFEFGSETYVVLVSNA